MISIKIWETPWSWHVKCSLPVAVRVSKTRVTAVLKLPIAAAGRLGLYRLWFEESASEKRWTEEDTRKLVTRLYRSGVTEECDIDWMEVKSEFEIDCSPYWLHRKWYHIKTRVPNYQLLDFEDAIDYLYQKYGKSNETSARDTE